MGDLCKPRILILREYYLPGYKSGGPIRTLANLVDRLGDHFEFRLLTRDRDSGDQKAYPKVQVNAWNQVGKAQVFYAAPEQQLPRLLRNLFAQLNPDLVYLNSFFSVFTIQALLLFRLHQLPIKPIILAPRGEFAPSALRLNPTKKQAYLALVQGIGLARNLTWQASSELEATDIRRVIGRHCYVQIAPNLPARMELHSDGYPNKPVKHPGKISLAFLSRIAPMKNLEHALETVSRLSEPVVFDIYGPVPPDEQAYWRTCEELISHMPPNVHVRYHGPVPNAQVASILSQYHFLLLPTRGENFGHIILEALVAGCPVLISDRTQWLDLARKRIGWDLPLDNRDLWHAVLQQCVAMDNDVYQQLSQSARRFALEYIASPVSEQQNIELFMRALHSSSRVK